MTVLLIEPGPAGERALLARPAASAKAATLPPTGLATVHSLRPSPTAVPARRTAGALALDLLEVLDPGAGLPRTHLVDRISAGDAGRLVTVTGPAGSGKTQLLAQCATAAAAAEPNRVVAWFRARPEDNTAQGVYRGIDRAVSQALNESASVHASAEELSGRLNDLLQSVTVFVDDEHNLHKPEAQDALSRAIELAGHRTRFVLSRRFAGARPIFAGSGSGATEIHAEDLRFTEAEVERLFTQYYGEALPPSAVADLTVVTGGWITGLALFQQSTAGVDPDERIAAITRLWRDSPVLRRYLDHNVLDASPEQVSRLLIQTSLLPTLSPELCDTILRESGSFAILQWLADRELFIDEFAPGHYRLDDFFREYLSHRLSEEAGATRMRGLRLRSALLLEGHGLWREAFRAYSELGDWSAGTRVLRESGIADARNGVVGLRSRAQRRTYDETAAWSAVANARQRLGFGDLAAAARLQESAAQQLSNPFDREMLLAELMRTQTWTAHSASSAACPQEDWAAALRQLVRTGRSQAPVPTSAAGGWHLVSAMAALAAGRVEEAVRHLHAADAPDNTFVPIAARIALAAITAITDPNAAHPDWMSLRNDAHAAGFPWLGRICLALAALDGGEEALCAPELVRKGCESDGDFWGALICDLITAVASSDRETGGEALGRAQLRADSLGEQHLAGWIRSLGEGIPVPENDNSGSDDRGADPGVDESWTDSEAATVSEIESTVVAPIAADDVPASAADESATAPSIAGDEAPAPATDEPAAPPPVVIRCFGAFSMHLDGESIDCSQLRPRARSLLRYLAAHAGRPVHEETLMEEFWSALPASSARHNLHVAVSAIRRFLDRHRPGRPSLLVRRGEAYVLALPTGSSCDVADFEAAVRRCRQSIASRGAKSPATNEEMPTGITSLRAALSLYHGHLLEDEGPVEWLCAERLRLQAVAVKLCVELAGAELSSGHVDAAVDACHRGIEIDRMNDACWRLLIEAQETRGDFASARRSRTSYDAVLADLGIDF